PQCGRPSRRVHRDRRLKTRAAARLDVRDSVAERVSRRGVTARSTLDFATIASRRSWGMAMKTTIAACVVLGYAATAAHAQSAASTFDRGHSQQAWQNSGYAAAVAK